MNFWAANSDLYLASRPRLLWAKILRRRWSLWAPWTTRRTKAWRIRFPVWSKFDQCLFRTRSHVSVLQLQIILWVGTMYINVLYRTTVTNIIYRYVYDFYRSASNSLIQPGQVWKPSKSIRKWSQINAKRLTAPWTPGERRVWMTWTLTNWCFEAGLAKKHWSIWGLTRNHTIFSASKALKLLS